ncbi:MAG: T9SS type A sorting domain-containing protein, partial [Bacteroidota bacterium]
GTPSSSTTAAGKLLRLKLNSNGDGMYISPTNADSTLKSSSAYTEDTVAYFISQNRFRDLAISPDGLSMFAIIDSSSTTSGPTSTNPANSLCKGCLIKYTFLGYADNAGKSSMPTSIPVTTGTGGTCTQGTTVVVNNDNKNLWVPITGPDGNILAEIYPNGNLLDTITSSFYINNSGTIRVDPTFRRILDRNITITPKNQPSVGSPVKVRLYLTNAEYTALQSNGASGVTSLSSLIIRKNTDPCSNNLVNPTTVNITPTYAEDFGTVGKMIQGENITSFSSFYIGSNTVILPLTLVYFNGTLENNTTLLKWRTSNEINTSQFIVERSIDAHNYQRIGTVAAKGNSTTANDYKYTDFDVMKQSSSVIYYRLKMVDIDGAYKYSNVVTITIPFITGRVAVFPNPANDEVSVSVSAPVDGKAQWKLVDNTGRVVMHSKVQLKEGNNGFSIDISKLSTGLYYLQVTGAEINENIKLQKL